MKNFLLSLALLAQAQATLYDLHVIDQEGRPMALSQFAGKVTLLVNVACD
jgi:glutathione peroxidase-family protein